MPTILLKKSDTPSAVPTTANLTNLAGGVEVAVNTADKRMFTMNSSSAVVELGTNPSSLTCADASFTVARVGSLTISSLSLTNATFASATITNLTSTSATISSALTLSGGTANGVLYLNGSKVATSGSALTFDGTSLGMGNPTVYGTRSLNSYTGTTASAIGFSQQISGFGDAFVGANNSGSSVLGMATGTFGQSTPNNIPWTVSAFGSEQMRLTSTGLGIGTSSPAYKLDVAESGAPTSTNTFSVARISGSDSVANDLTLLGPNTSQVRIKFGDPESATVGEVGYNHSTNALRFVTNGSEVGVFDSSGNLGLGVTPSAWSTTGNLQLKSGSNISAGTGIGLYSNGYFNAGWKYIDSTYATGYGQSGGSHLWYIAASGTAGGTISFTQAMTLDADGDLGVGETAPDSKLHVKANGRIARFAASTGTSAAYLAFSNTGGNYFIGADNSAGNALLATGGAAYGFTIVAETADPIVFGTDNTERARITSGGDLLVGDTANSAGARLYVKGSGATSGSVAMVVRNSTPSDLLYIRNDGYMTFGISPAMTLTAGGDLLVGTTTYQSKRITIDGGSGGAVWANCSTSANPVNVTYNTATSGDNLFEEFYTDGGVLRGTISYNRGAGQVSYNVTSDARLKDNIADAADAGNKVDALQVRQFDWKETGNHVDYGFIAQELHEVAPQAVSKPEDDEKMWSVDYSKLVPMLVKEIQSLRARVAQLESK
jgi:hypothetical protein